jgi:outer membrane protein assembly factor BamB
MNPWKKLLHIGTVAGLCFGGTVFAQESAMSSFSTGGHTVYNLRTGVIEPGGETVLIAAAFDGAVLCFSKDGKRIWKNDQNQAVPYDLDVANLDGDGRDETLLASADGTLYVFDHQGALLWKFSRETPLLQVHAAKKPAGTTVILTGGIERKLYALSPQGKVLHTREFDSVIRHIRAGNILGDGKEYASVLFTKNANTVTFIATF